MRPLTDNAPKPLLRVHGQPLIAWHLHALARAGVRDVVVNTAWLEAQFPVALGRGERFGLHIAYSQEGRDHGGALETAGGIAKALPQLGDVFWVVSGDVYLPGFDFAAQSQATHSVWEGRHDAHLFMVPNASHHPTGDFAITPEGLLQREPPADGSPRRTWASVGVFHRRLFEDLPVGQALPLRPLLEHAMAQGRLGGSLWPGAWTDVGTPQRLQALNDTPWADLT